MRRVISVLALVVSCGSAPAAEAPAPDEDPGPRLAYTSWAASSELFAEMRALVVGREAPCAAHVTRLFDFAALTEGRVVVVLRDAGGAEERWEASEVTRPGIFRPVVRPGAAGPRSLRVEIHAAGIDDVHELGEVTVYASVADAIAAIPEEPEPPGRITFLKEQQWVIPFGTAEAHPRALRPSLRVFGRIEARPEGDVVVTAPSAGRIADRSLPALGTLVERDATLASLAPRLEAADRASLDLAVAAARMDVTQAERERARLEGLLADGVVPERRLLEARHAEDEARAALIAAERRLALFARTLRTGGSSAGAIPIRAPIAGEIVAALAAPGAFVAEGDPLFHVVAPGSVWLALDVPEGDLPALGAELSGAFRLAGEERERRVDAADLVARPRLVDPASHTAQVRFRLEGEGVAVGTHVEARLYVDAPETQLAIPWDAVLDDGGYFVAFVQVEGEAFERRPLRLGTRDGDWVGIQSGVREGEHVVTTGALAVKLAGASGTVPAHGHAH